MYNRFLLLENFETGHTTTGVILEAWKVDATGRWWESGASVESRLCGYALYLSGHKSVGFTSLHVEAQWSQGNAVGACQMLVVSRFQATRYSVRGIFLFHNPPTS